MGNSDLSTALWITLLGMVLVFIGILLLWGMMELLVRITRKREKAEEPSHEPASTLDDRSMKQRRRGCSGHCHQFANSTAVSAPILSRKFSAPGKACIVIISNFHITNAASEDLNENRQNPKYYL